MKSIHFILALAFTISSYAGTPKPAASAGSTPKTKTPTQAASAKTIVADVDGIVCAFCVQGIQKIFKNKGKAEEVAISLELKKVFVTEKKGETITDAEFRETIRQAGFKTQSITRSELSIAAAKERLAHKQTLVAQAPATKSVQTAAR